MLGVHKCFQMDKKEFAVLVPRILANHFLQFKTALVASKYLQISFKLIRY